MDEKGVRLKSESHMAFSCARSPLPSHIMIFDKPFLVVLERADAKVPYFVMWIDNPELLVP
jgi:serine protease inhibitor